LAAFVSKSTPEAPPMGAPAESVAEPGRARRYALSRPWVLVGFGLVVVSLLLLVWARTRPGYDPFGWLVWGDQTLHLSLDLGGAPSWKPLPYLFTIPYALAGHDQMWLWMVTATTVSLAGCIFAGRIAYRLTGGGSAEATGAAPIRRYAPIVAAVFAGLAVLGLEDYMHYILSAQSDPMIVTFCLAGIDMYLGGHYRWAFVFGVLGSLGRPEVWPFLGLYSIWAWLKVPAMRWMIYGGLALIAFMWFGIPWITNGRPDIAGELALRSPRELHQGKILGTIGRLKELQYLPIWIAAAVAVAVAALRRNWTVLVLAVGVLTWLLIEIAFAFHGFPALPRYMFEPGAIVGVLAAVGVGWVLVELPELSPRLPSWAGAGVLAALAISLVPGAVARVRAEHTDLGHERGRTNEIGLLTTTIDAVGGDQRIRACGEPVTVVEYASALAWLTHLDVGFVGYLPSIEMRHRYPIVLMLPVSPGGWAVRPWHTRHRQRAQCAGLHASYVLTKTHPSGVLLRG
jgi:hypothetical protein